MRQSKHKCLPLPNNCLLHNCIVLPKYPFTMKQSQSQSDQNKKPSPSSCLTEPRQTNGKLISPWAQSEQSSPNFLEIGFQSGLWEDKICPVHPILLALTHPQSLLDCPPSGKHVPALLTVAEHSRVITTTSEPSWALSPGHAYTFE